MNAFVNSPAVGNGMAFVSLMKSGVFLVVDDFDSMRKVTINQLRQLGASKIFEAANGAEALRVISREPVTMVLSDWNMPVMNGLELLLAVRADAKLFGLPFLMITAEAERGRVMQAVQSGVSALLVKPYTAARLADRIEKALDWKPPAAAAAVLRASALPGSVVATVQVQPIAKPERPTILVVDDTPDNLLLLSGLFKEEFRVKIAHNGDKALQICHSDTPPDLILLDIMMPGMDGFEVAQQLRAHPSSEHIPVIFVTAMTDDASRLKGLELGAVDFVTKPIDPTALTLRVRNFMRYVELHMGLQADYDGMLAAERLKEEVEQITRHDMKGPLAGVIGLVQGLIDTSKLNTDEFETLRMIEETALQVMSMINLSAELHKMETGRFQLHAQAVPLAKILRRLATIARTTFAIKELTINISTPAGIRDEALLANGDEMLCYSLFQNLFKNACEAAPANTVIAIAIAHRGEQLSITMDNKGVVPVVLRERFFEKYATVGKQGGSGLGTYSAKLLAESQGGSVAMETSDEAGSTRLIVSLPALS